MLDFENKIFYYLSLDGLSVKTSDATIQQNSLAANRIFSVPVLCYLWLKTLEYATSSVNGNNKLMQYLQTDSWTWALWDEEMMR